MTLLAKIIEKKSAAPLPNLVDILTKRLGEWDRPRHAPWIHASDLTFEEYPFCPREHALRHVTQWRREGKFITAAMAATFAQGREIARVICEEDNWFGKEAVGDWKCQHCGHEHRFSRKPVFPCKTCGGRRWEYRELRVMHWSGAAGGLDLVLNLGQPKLIMVELKIIDKDEFAKLIMPKPEHRLRTAMYLHMIAQSDDPVMGRLRHDRAKVFYSSRGFGKKSVESGKIVPWKEFEVTKEDADVQPYFDMAYSVTLFKHGQAPIPAGICSTPHCTRAKSCTALKACWSGQFPAGEYYAPSCPPTAPGCTPKPFTG